MNRFFNQKKTADDPSSPISPPQQSKKWKKNRKEVVEQKPPQFDLGAALPPSDDFRTSLLMPNLSARFSMLKEQDDPNSKIGKAMDDSVLNPQRNSRLLDFGFSTKTNLNDIAEVASIHGSIRPPFTLDRQGSGYSEEGYGTDSESMHTGSVMSRARPGEGNVLFGGRQKVYKIANGSAKSIGGGSERSMGRLVYDDDVSMSAFQKHRLQEKERLAAAGIYLDSDSAPMSPTSDAQPRNSEEEEQQQEPKGLGLSNTDTGFSWLKRNSGSTTNSIPSQDHNSSAATSVASQSIGTAVTTPATPAFVTHPSPASSGPGLERSATKRRLYDQGLNQHIHDQQASTMTRLNSIQRHRSPTVGSNGPAPVVLHHSRSIGNFQERRAYQPYALQNPSPPSQQGMPKLNTTLSGSTFSSTSSPMTLAFPASPISPVIPETEEYQTLSSALEPADRGKATALGAFNKPAQKFDEQQYLKRTMQMEQAKDLSPRDEQPESSPTAPVEPATSAGAEQTPVSNIMAREFSASRQVSGESATPESRLARFDSARQNSTSRNSETSQSRSRSTSRTQPEPPISKAFAVFQKAANQNCAVNSPPQPAVETFAKNDIPNNLTFFGDGSDDEEEADETHPAPPAFQHPALRNDMIHEVDEGDEITGFTPPGTASTTITHSGLKDEGLPEIDSPTIGPQGIGGLISQHLRNTSDVSSIYPADPPYGGGGGYSNRDTYLADRPISGVSRWNMEELDNYYGDLPTRISNDYSDPSSRVQDLAPAPLRTSDSPDIPSIPHDSHLAESHWHNELKTQHTRDASTATQAEREAFANELAARQRAIQQKMRSVVDSDSRGPSPAPAAGGALKAFGMLRSKPSHERGLKNLGLGLTGTHPADRKPSHDDRIPQPPAAGAQWPLGPGPVAPSPNSQDGEGRGRDDRTGLRQATLEKEQSRNSSASRSRSRARSRSRSIRNEVGVAMSNIFGSSPAMPTQRPSPEASQYRSPSTEDRGRMRSDSRSASASAGLHPATKANLASQSTSGLSSSQGSVPRLPTGVMSPPIGSGAGAMKSAFPKPQMQPLGRSKDQILRKRTVNKFEISEPTLISSTSNIDTVDLPAGASLQNGMSDVYAVEQQVPSVSTRRRKLFGFGKALSSETMREKYNGDVTSPPMPMSGFTSSPMNPAVSAFGTQEQTMSRKPSVDTNSGYSQAMSRKLSVDTGSGYSHSQTVSRKPSVDTSSSFSQIQRKPSVDTSSSFSQIQRKPSVDTSSSFSQIQRKASVDTSSSFSQIQRKPSVDTNGSYAQMQRKPSGSTTSPYAHTLRSQASTETTPGSARFDAVGSPVLNEAGMF